MKISIDGKVYELTDECIASLFQLLRKPIAGKLPGELQGTIDNTNHPDQLPLMVEALKDYGLGYYQQLPTPKRLSVMAVVRAGIAKLEKKFGEPAKVFRPPKKADPVEHVASVIYPVVEKHIPLFGKFFEHATLTFTIENESVTNIGLAYPTTGGGQVATDGNVRFWQDYSSKTSQQEYSKAVS